MRRKQRVVFRTDLTVVIEAPWSPDCTIDQVVQQATEAARRRLQTFRAESRDVLVTPEPRLVRVILDEVPDER